MKIILVIWICVYLVLFDGYATAINFPPSPCPDVYFYEDTSTDGNMWYGSISLKSQSDSIVIGFQLRVSLDKPAQLLCSWEGNVISNDNTIFVIYNPAARLQPQQMVNIRIMVKFDPTKPIPFLQTIHFNGRRACPPDSPLTLSAGSLEQPAESRPDPALQEWTDVDSEHTSGESSTTGPKTSASTSAPVRCGHVDLASPLITHGSTTTRGQWPWHVALYKSEGTDLSYKCGATIISRSSILTAAHCVINAQGKPVSSNTIVLLLGKHKLNQYSDEEGVQVKQVSRIHVHPDYNIHNYYGDIAILMLNTPIEYNKYVKPICVWEESPGISEIVGKEGMVVGWGLDETDRTTQDLRSARLPVVSSDTCVRSFPQFYNQFTSNSSFCAGFLNGTSPCNGDSGGGLTIFRETTWYLRGIVSLSVAREGLNFCDSRYYVIFTDVSKYREFIDRFVKFP